MCIADMCNAFERYENVQLNHVYVGPFPRSGAAPGINVDLDGREFATTLDKVAGYGEQSSRMSASQNSADQLWQQYGALFHRFDDLTLARWLVQTLAHFNGGLWRYSHPLVGAYKLAAQAGHQRQIWLKRLASFPNPFVKSDCCRAPLLPLVTRDVVESGLICMHCNETAVPFSELPESLQHSLKEWSEPYAAVHRVAHWDDDEKASVGSFEDALDAAAEKAAKLLKHAVTEVFPKLLEVYPAVIWEDHDECLEVRPEDLVIEDQ